MMADILVTQEARVISGLGSGQVSPEYYSFSTRRVKLVYNPEES